MRVSSPSMAAAFMDGAREQGASIVDYGMIGTDMLYYGVARDGLEGGVMVTASHNPGEYNGMKMVRREAFPLSGEAGLAEIREMILADAIPAPAGPRGGIESRDLLKEYVEHVLSFIDAGAIKPFNVVLDAGSGIGGLVAPPLFDRLPCKTTRLCFEVDGTFPNHEANPLIEENRRDIVERRDRAHAGFSRADVARGAQHGRALGRRRLSRRRVARSHSARGAHHQSGAGARDLLERARARRLDL